MFDYNRGLIEMAVAVIETAAGDNKVIKSACAKIVEALGYEEWGQTWPTVPAAGTTAAPDKPAPSDKSDKGDKPAPPITPAQQPDKPEKKKKPAADKPAKPLMSALIPAPPPSDKEREQDIADIQAAIDAEKATDIRSAVAAIVKHKIKLAYVADLMKYKTTSLYTITSSNKPISKPFVERFGEIFKLHTAPPAPSNPSPESDK